MSSAEHSLSADARSTLLRVASSAIEYGLSHSGAPDIDPALYSEELQAEGASFVTLHRAGKLRGCMGALLASRSLVHDVSHNAWRSSTVDPRFSPLRREEFTDLEIHISVVSPLSPFPVSGEEQLLRELRPKIDGLVLRDRGATATFLPSVWDQLETPERFVAELLHKANLERNHWSDTIEFERYTVEEF